MVIYSCIFVCDLSRKDLIACLTWLISWITYFDTNNVLKKVKKFINFPSKLSLFFYYYYLAVPFVNFSPVVLSTVHPCHGVGRHSIQMAAEFKMSKKKNLRCIFIQDFRPLNSPKRRRWMRRTAPVVALGVSLGARRSSSLVHLSLRRSRSPRRMNGITAFGKHDSAFYYTGL